MTTIPTIPTLPLRARLRSLLVLLAGLATLAASAVPAAAATRTWSGGAGPVNNQWTITSNWQGGVAPVAGDDLVFPTGVAQSVTVNNFPAGTSFGSITFNASYTVTGNAIAMTGTFTIASAGSPTVTFGLPIAIASAPDLIVSVGVGDAATLTLGGPLSGAAGLIKAGNGRLRLSGANTYTGATTIQTGWIMAAHPQALGSAAAGTTIETLGTLIVESNIPAEPIAAQNTTASQSIYCDDAGTFSLGGPIVLASGEVDMAAGFGCHLVFNGPMSGAADLRFATYAPASITLNAVNTFTGIARVGDSVFLGVNDALAASSIINVSGVLDFQNHSQTMKSLAGGGDVLLGSATLTIDAPESALSFQGVISGAGGIVKKGVGTWFLAGANTYTGPTLVQGGFLSVPGSIVSPVTLDGGTLQGRGAVGAIGGSSGTLELTYVGPPSKLTSGSIALAPGITFQAIVNGPGAGTQYSQLAVNGSVDLGGATLDADVDFNFLTANVGELILIDNDGVDAAVGTFQGLAQDSIIQSGGKAFRLSYVGGTGNDVTLTPTESTYYLSEGATGSFFETFILIANTHVEDIEATLTFLPASGVPVQKKKTVPTRGRITVNVEAEDPSLADAAVATQVTSFLPKLIVERAQYWPSTPDQWHEAHNSFGVTAPATRWGLAEGRAGGPENYQTYLLLANPGMADADVTVNFLRESGAPFSTKIAVPAQKRVNLSVGPGGNVPELANERFGAVITSDQPIVVERAMFWDANGQFWSAGTNATATRLP